MITTDTRKFEKKKEATHHKNCFSLRFLSGGLRHGQSQIPVIIHNNVSPRGQERIERGPELEHTSPACLSPLPERANKTCRPTQGKGGNCWKSGNRGMIDFQL